MKARDLMLLVGRSWERRSDSAPLTYEHPDHLERNRPAVDLLGRDDDGTPRLILEHTLAESFLDQRTAQIAAVRMFEPLERERSGQMPSPGHFALVVKPKRVLGLKRKVDHIREWVAAWILETAPSLQVGGEGLSRHWARTTVPATSLEVTLYRWPRRDGELELVFEAPVENENVLTPSLDRAIKAKTPKLSAAKRATPSATSVLLLEISDLALGNLFDLDAVVQVWCSTPSGDMPDEVWLADTALTPPDLMVSKEGGTIGHAITARFLPEHNRAG